MKRSVICFCAAGAALAASAATSADAPIGVFDSGVGGLTVLEQLLSVDDVDNRTGAEGSDGVPDLAGEAFVQLADQANLHYGSYAAAGSAAFLRELAVRDAQFLLSPGYYRDAAEEIPSGRKTPAKIVVVACNTATAYGLPGIVATLRNAASPVRVIGVVNAGCRSVFASLKAGPDTRPFAVGVMSTPGTCASGVYPKTLLAEAARVGMKAPPRVVARGCVNLADSIQFCKPDAGAIVRRYFREIVEELRADGAKTPLRALVFGCTHYPLARRHFEAALAEIRADASLRPHVADDFTFVDPAAETARECRRTLAAEGLLARRAAPTKVSMFVSVPSAALDPKLIGADGTLEDGCKYARKPGRDVVDTKFVPVAVGLRDRDKFRSLLELLPSVRRSLKWD